MKQEAWRFTSVARLPKDRSSWRRRRRGVPDARRDPAVLVARQPVIAWSLLTVSFNVLLSTPFFDDVQSLAHVVTHRQDLVREHLGKYATTQDRPFSALNTAFVSARRNLCTCPPRRRSRSRSSCCSWRDGDKQVVTHPRNLVVIEREARASIV